MNTVKLETNVFRIFIYITQSYRRNCDHSAIGSTLLKHISTYIIYIVSGNYIEIIPMLKLDNKT